jgi:hypothetical protein
MTYSTSCSHLTNFGSMECNVCMYVCNQNMLGYDVFFFLLYFTTCFGLTGHHQVYKVCLRSLLCFPFAVLDASRCFIQVRLRHACCLTTCLVYLQYAPGYISGFIRWILYAILYAISAFLLLCLCCCLRLLNMLLVLILIRPCATQNQPDLLEAEIGLH